MLTSPCLIRSPHCARLILLAAAIAVVRVEACVEAIQPPTSLNLASDTRVATLRPVGYFIRSAACLSPWLQPVSATPSQTFRAAPPAIAVAVAEPPATPTPFSSSPVRPLRTFSPFLASPAVAHLIPFAVGPPQTTPDPPSPDLSAPTTPSDRSPLVASLFLQLRPPAPRLARRRFSRRSFAGLTSASDLAPRGEPQPSLGSPHAPTHGTRGALGPGTFCS